jgi:hypothetical protein
MKKAKQMWEMTPAELADWLEGPRANFEQASRLFKDEMKWPEGRVYCSGSRDQRGYVIKTAHMGIVRWAITQGKRVPAKIRALYPEFKELKARL